MGWPKGMPRKGHVNKDGTAHRKKGEKLATELRVRAVTKTPDRLQVVTKPDPSVPTVQKFKKTYVGKQWATIAPCPDCGAPDAFAFCENCGWYQYDPTCPHCKKVGRNGQ